MASPIHVKIRRVYDAPSSDDGVRILVDRLWPRGLTKERAAVDRWMREIAPSTELRKHFGHRPELWPEFQEAYRAELENQENALSELRSLAEAGPLTLLYSAKDTEHNNAVVLREILGGKGR